MSWLLWMVIAYGRSPCADLKPKKPPSPETMNLVGSVLQTALSTAGVPVAIPPGAASSLLQQDGPEKSWFYYQICTLKEAGLLSSERAQELVAASLAPPPAPSPAPGMPTGVGPPAPSAAGVYDVDAMIRQAQIEQRQQLQTMIDTYCGQPSYAEACGLWRQVLQSLPQ
jgi:hypothetical protein